MKSTGKLILGILFIFLALEVLILAPDDLNPPEDDQSLEEITDTEKGEIKRVMVGAHAVETRDESKEWELRSKKAVEYSSSGNWELEEVEAHFFADDGVSFVVTGSGGKVDFATKNMEIFGDVTTRSSNGYLFRTEKMNYDSEKRTLYSDSVVKMTGPKDAKGRALTLNGASMLTEMAKSLMEVMGPVKGRKVVQGGKTLSIRSGRALFSAASNDARFVDNVTMDMDSMRISGPEAKFQYSEKKGEVTDVEVKGGVRVSDRDKWATAKQVSFNLERDKFVFKGSPRLVQDQDELVGDKIIFLNGGKRVQVLKARARLDKQRLDNEQ